MTDQKKPIMYMIAGPNGAGKSTLYETRIKPKIKALFINADKIQKEEMKDPSMQASYKAAKIAEERRQNHLQKKESFVSESTFSHPSKLKLIDEAKAAGFTVVLYHVNVRNSDLSVKRVEARVKSGGHDVPEDKIRARYERNQSLIKEAVKRSDRAFIYDNSIIKKPPKLNISFNKGKIDRISENIPAWARELYKNELAPYSQTIQNAAAASYKDIKKIANEIGGKDAKTLIPSAKEKNYTGIIAGESSLHVLQTTKNKNEFVVHFKSSLDKKPKITQDVEITYQSKNKATVTKSKRKSLKDQDKLALYDKSLKALGVSEKARKKIQHKNK